MFHYIVSCILLHDRMIAWHIILWLCIQLNWHQHIKYLTLILDTWYLTYDIWHRTIDMLSLVTDTFNLMLWHLIGYYYTGHLYYIAHSWLSLLWGLDMIIILLPDICTAELLCSWTPVFLNPVTGRLLILHSCWSP